MQVASDGVDGARLREALFVTSGSDAAVASSVERAAAEGGRGKGWARLVKRRPRHHGKSMARHVTR